jgi:hypothetical protein
MGRTQGRSRIGLRCAVAALAALVLLAGRPGLGLAQGQDRPALFTAEGVGVIVNQNHARARDRAIVDGLRGCVEQALVELVEPELILDNYPLIAAEVLERAEGYIRRYRIFHEEAVPDETIYRVAVQASVAQSLLKSNLHAMGLYVERRGKPKVMVLLEEVAADGAEPPGGSPSRRAFVEHFQSRGFPVVEDAEAGGSASDQALAGNAQAAASLGLKSGAQVVLMGKTVLRRILPATGLGPPSYQATISVRAVDAKEARVVAVGSESAVALAGETSEPVGVIKEAASKVAAFMADQLMIQWRVEETESKTIALAIEKVSVPDLAQIRAGITGGVSGVRRFVQRRYSSEGAILEVDYSGESAQLAEAISQVRFGLFSVQVVGVGPQRIDLQVLP